MSRAASPFAGRLYGVVRVTREWEMARSSFYYQLRIAAQPQRVLRRRGPKTECSDETLTGKIREVLAASPFYGEGHRKVWARLRMAGVRTSKARVLRLMREAQWLAPSRTLPKAENPHTGTIITERPNKVWASDHTATATVEDGQVTVFVAVDHCTTECVGLHAAKKATRFEALEPLRQGVRDYCGGFRAGAAAGIRNRHDHGSQYLSDDYQAEIAFLGMQSSPSFVRQPECNGCVERFIRTLKEQFLWVRTFQNVEELRHGLAEFRERYNQRWIVQRWGYLTPAQARHSKSVLWKSPRSRGKSHAALARLVICLICSPTSSPVYLSSISSSASRRCWLFVSSSSRILANLTLDQKGRYRVSVGGSASVDFLFELVKASDY